MAFRARRDCGRLCRAVAQSEREEALRVARASLELEGEIRALQEDVLEAEAATREREAALAELLRARDAVVARYGAPRLLRDLAATRDALEARSDDLVDSVLSRDAPLLGSSGSGLSDARTSVSDDARTAFSTERPAPAAAAAALREFRDEYLEVRKRFRSTGAKIDVLRQQAQAASRAAAAAAQAPTVR